MTPEESLYIHPLLFISFNSSLNLFYSGFCLHQFTETLLSNSLVTSSLLNPKINFQLTSYLTYQQHLTRLIIPASLTHLVSLVTTISQFLLYGPILSHLCRISQSPNVALLFFYTLTPLLISNLIRVLNANDFDLYLTEFLDLST